MRSPSILTVVVKVDPDKIVELERYLRDSVNPAPDGATKAFGFENYPNLHFISFSIPPEEGELPAQLVMEATFDGPEDAFIRDLVALDLRALAGIFGHCCGFPKMARRNPHLIESFLKQHAAPAPTFFSGAPGKTVAQIRREQSLRDILGHALRKAPDKVLNAEPRRLQDYLRREALAHRGLGLLSQPATPPATLTYGDRMLRRVGAAMLLPVILLGVLVFWANPWGVSQGWRDITNAEGVAVGCLVLIAAVALLFVNYMQDWATRAGRRVNPSAWPFVVNGVAGMVALAIKVFLAILGAQLVLQIADWLAGYVWPGCWIFGIVMGIICAFLFAITYFVAVYFGMVRGSAAALKRADRTTPEAPQKWLQTWASFIVFWPLFFLSFVPLITIFAGADWDWLDTTIETVWPALVMMAGWFSMGLIVVIILWLVFLMFHALGQSLENKRLANPLRLYDERSHDPDRWAREEHGYMRCQNHYISLTHVKSCFLRGWLLTLALSVVNFLARYKDNKGTLGGIPTIFSARWVLIDGGKRLMFMTNYSGAWDSYLNEFSELASVIGVNLIWTNTYIATDEFEGKDGVRFPNTELYTGRGARATLPFKAYVRRSQLETLAWYSAYPDLSVVNVIENAKLRDAVFGPTDVAALDLLLKRL